MLRTVALFLLFFASATFAANTVTHYHKVKHGETLKSISKKYGVPLANLKKINNIKGSSIRTGQRILVRKAERATASVSAPKRSKSSRASRSYDYYTVRRGDSLSEISRKTGISIKQLRSVNHLKNSVLRAGQRLKIRTFTWVERPVDMDINPTSILSGSEKTYYKVKAGDTLDSIAQQYDLSTERLKEANLLQDERLKTNQILVIPMLRDSISEETDIAEG